MSGYKRMTNTPPVIDVDGSLWTVMARNQGPGVEVGIQICDGFDLDENREQPCLDHEFDGEWHDGDTHLFLDNDAASRLLQQLQQAFHDRIAERPHKHQVAREPDLRRTLLELYFDQGITGVRDHLHGLCPGCVTDLVIGYVVADSQRALEFEFGTA
jgi:hypothetical protein